MCEKIAMSLVFVAGRRAARALGYCRWSVSRLFGVQLDELLGLVAEDGCVRASGAERLTRVGQRNLRTRAVTEAGAHGRNDESHDGTDAADDDGPKDGGLVAGSPLDVETRGRPELYGSHCESDMGVYTVQVVNRWCSWSGNGHRRNFGRAWRWQLSACRIARLRTKDSWSFIRTCPF